MNEQHFHAQITSALTGRQGQRPFVDELSRSWTTLATSFDDLLGEIADTERSWDGAAADDHERRVRAALADLSRRDDEQGRTELDRLRDRVAGVSRQVEAVQTRVHRDTVNIGVLGSTKVGKSTLLRTITRLPETVIPTTAFHPTTAAASRIYHTTAAPSATLTLHTWESFRDGYLAPLHRRAGLGAPPRRPDDFRAIRYQAPGSAQVAAAADDHLRKLLTAHRSFDSYAHLLARSDRTMTVEFTALRPYVAYPDIERGDSLELQPYHAVRGVQIEQQFPAAAATRLGLIDMPGAQEAGLDINEQFLQRQKNEIDMLLALKRGNTTSAPNKQEDSDIWLLADSARAGVQLDDFFAVVVNRDSIHDPSGQFFDATVRNVTARAQQRNIRVLQADVTSEDDVYRNVMGPALQHLGSRLVEMDRAAVGAALALATEVSAEVAAFAEHILNDAELLHALPTQEHKIRDAALDLRAKLADDLGALTDRYDRHVSTGGDTELTAGITAAVKQARAWVREGLGRGSRDEWLKDRGYFVAGSLNVKQDRYYQARVEITRIFEKLDSSVDRAVSRLWGDVAETLRGRLTEDLVPLGEDALEELRKTAHSRRATILRDALVQLSRLKLDYGSVVLRVTQPIIRGIDWDNRQPSRTEEIVAAAAPVVVAAAAAAAGVPVAPPGWRVRPDGAFERVAHTVEQRLRPPAPPGRRDASGQPDAIPGGRQAAARQDAERLYDELGSVVTACIDELEKALQQEARTTTRTLAAAADRFMLSVIRTNLVERDFEDLCKPNQRTIWPDLFGDGRARLAGALAAIEGQAKQVVASAQAVAGMSTGLRLHTVADTDEGSRASWRPR